jgi:hypothetical protein
LHAGTAVAQQHLVFGENRFLTLWCAYAQARDDKERHQKGADFAQKNPNAKWNPFAQREHHATEEARWRMQQWGLGGRTQDDFARDQAERLKLEREREPSWWNPFHHKSNSTAVGELPKQGATKPWYDFMPAHQDRTKETKLALLKAVATGKEADIVNAAAQHKVCVRILKTKQVHCFCK